MLSPTRLVALPPPKTSASSAASAAAAVAASVSVAAACAAAAACATAAAAAAAAACAAATAAAAAATLSELINGGKAGDGTASSASDALPSLASVVAEAAVAPSSGGQCKWPLRLLPLLLPPPLPISPEAGHGTPPEGVGEAATARKTPTTAVAAAAHWLVRCRQIGRCLPIWPALDAGTAQQGR